MIRPRAQNLALSGRPRILRGLPRPTDEFRRNSWLAFQIALDRYLLRRARGAQARERLFSTEQLDGLEEAGRNVRSRNGGSNRLKSQPGL
jgi:hypothetical protein